MSKRRRCLSEDPETTRGGMKSIDAILLSKVQRVSIQCAKIKMSQTARRTLDCDDSRMYVITSRCARPRVE